MALKSSSRHQENDRKGRLAESAAAWFLRLKGYRILHQRYKTPVGEIDLVAMRGKTIAFVEVKLRQSLDKGLEALSPFQQKRIVDGARFFQAKCPDFYDYDFRFDYVVVCKGRCHHMENAWQAF